MSIVNTRDKTINTKIVYYGPGLGGKTTSLQYVHSVLDPDMKVKMVSLKTDEERTLFFDFLPISLGELDGYEVRIQGFTVPGQVKYNLTRKYVLMGADAVVFVADSAPDRLEDNVRSFGNLLENMRDNGLDPEHVPIVLQYNKRDLPDALPVEELDATLNAEGRPAFATDAIQGDHVFDAFIEAAARMLDATAHRYGLDREGTDVASATRALLQSLAQPAG
ncbi:MAG: ADP-ribosylation factor-like protein [Planctomycetota bacterium]